jgi:hypothetical protein
MSEQKRLGAKEFTRIAAATGVAVDTVRRYYAGRPVTVVNRAVIERACLELDLPTQEEVARG